MGIVGLTKIGRFGRWNVIYSNGTDKPVSWLWNIVPEKLRSYWLLYRHICMKRGICMILTLSVLYQFFASEEKWIRSRARGRPKDEIHTKGMG